MTEWQSFLDVFLPIANNSLNEGFLYGIMALGVFITFRVMDFPDMTVDGSFPLGAALMASLMAAGLNPFLALAIAFLGGALAGAITAAIHNYLKIPNLLAGIITMTMLWSINIRIMGSANINLSVIKGDNATTMLEHVVGWLKLVNIPSEWGMVIFFAFIAFLIKMLLDLFFRTDLGLTLGAMGNNPQMVISSGVDPSMLKFIGLGFSNGMVAIAGAFACQYQGFADVSLGQQIIISGLASVMIGEFIIRSNRISLLTLRVLIGSIIFRALMYLARVFGFDIGLLPTDQRLLTGVLIILALAVSQILKQNAKAKRTAPAGAAKPGKEAIHG